MYILRGLRQALMVSAVCIPGVAFAQAASASGDKAEASNGIADIVVTAQRREETAQKASISIAVISPSELTSRGIVDSQSLNDVVPGLKIAYTAGQVQTFIRGVGDVSANAYTQASVALNVDGVYLARTQSFGPLFFDVARVEVLRGPQGTLYGRNASGGAINIITNAPKLTSVEGFASLEIGNYNLKRGQAAINLPLSENFALRLAAQVTDRDGYLSDGSNDDKSQMGRVRALWQASDTLTVNAIFEAGHQGGKGGGRVYRPALFGDPWTGPQDSRITSALYPTLLVRNNNSLQNNFWSMTVQSDLKLSDSATLTVIPAYRYLNSDGNIGADLIFAEHDISHQKSLEARLGGDAGKLKYVLGAFAFREDLSINIVNDQRRASPLTGNYSTQIFPNFDTSAWAAFGELTYSLTDTFRAIGGLRYTEETRSSQGDGATYPYVNGVQTGNILRNSVDISSTVHKITWKAGVELDVGPQSMLYANASTGFKSGGFSASIADPYSPEYVTAYQVGSKNRIFDNTLQLNVEGFLWKYKDQQIAFLGVDALGNSSFITRNAGQSTLYGVSTDIIWKPTPNDTLDLGAEYLHTKYDQFTYTTPGNSVAGTLRDDGCLSGGPAAKAGFQIVNCTGQRLQRAPKFSGNIRYTHKFDLSSGANITVGGTAKFASQSYLQLNFRSPYFEQKAYQLYDADIGYESPNGRWNLLFYIRNIKKTPVYLTASNQSSIPATSGPARTSVNAIGAPRTFGGTLKLKF